MEVLREEKQLRFCPWMHKQREGHEFAVRGCSATHGGEEENLRETEKCPQKPVHEEDPETKSW